MSHVTWFDSNVDEGQRNWTAIAAELRTRPGAWACVGFVSRGLAWKVSSGGVQAVDPEQFEVAARAIPGNKRPLLWVRYLPDPVGEAPAPEAAPILTLVPAPAATIEDALVRAMQALTEAISCLVGSREASA